MFKFVQKHKIFILAIVALLMLFIGSFFMFTNKETNDTKAGECTFTFTFSAYMSGSKNGNSTGTYVGGGGDTYSGAIGSISVSRTGSGGSWSGSTSTNTTTGSASCKFTSTNNNPFVWKDWSCRATVSTSASSGFYASSYPSTYTNGIDGTFGALVWNDYSGSFYCYFAARTYTISYNANGGTLTGASSNTVKFYDKYKLSSATRTGYTFAGWYTSASGGTQVTTSTCYNSASNKTLYAHWTANTYNVTLDRNIASGTSDLTGGNYRAGTTSLTATYDSTYPSITTPIRNGYTFDGFYTSGGTKIYNASGTSSVKCTTADHHTLYARWTANTIAITLDQQSGTGGTGAVYYKYDTNKYYSNASCTTTLSSITKPTRTGYTFGGYYTSTGGGGTQYITASGGFTNSLFKNIYASSTLYAKWTENDYSIQYLPNGGSGSMSNSTGILYTTSFTLPTNAFYRYGYLFKGWATSAVAVDASITYYDQQTVSKLSATDNDIVKLYAVWEKTWAVDKQTPSGAGTSTDPYLISTPQHLGWMAYQTETKNLSGYFKQTAHISLAGETYLPIGDSSCKFIGNYDGNNYVITNLTTTETRVKSNTGNFKYSYQGLFGYTNNATIDNVKVLSGTIKGYNYTGGIVGYSGTSTITNCQVGSVSIYANIYSNGGIVGYGYSSTLTGCYSKAQMSGGSYHAGILGNSNGCTFTACAFEGTLANMFFGYQMVRGSSTATKLYDCFAKTTTANGFAGGSFTKDSCLYIAGTNKKYYAGNFTNWVITTTNTPLPQGLSWLATGGTKVTSVNDITALGYTAA
ncbi:MAG: InlB B-repeat-containing protein [Clostridia bacterium]|nr:InlB B-repeat-containing protein [Clostridia bacterium]